MIKSLFTLLIYFSLSYDLIELGFDLNLLSKTSTFKRNPKIKEYEFCLIDVDSEESDDYAQINLYSCLDGPGLEDLHKSVNSQEMKKIESFINVIESNCECILYFLLTEGVHQLDINFYNVWYSATSLRFKDYYELNCPAKDYSQAVSLFKYLNQTTGIKALKRFMDEILNNNEAFELISKDRKSNYQLRVNFLSDKSCNVTATACSDSSKLLICWLKYIISFRFSNLYLFNLIITKMGYEDINCDKYQIGVESLIKKYFPDLYKNFLTSSASPGLVEEIIYEYSGISLPFDSFKHIENYFSKY